MGHVFPDVGCMVKIQKSRSVDKLYDFHARTWKGLWFLSPCLCQYFPPKHGHVVWNNITIEFQKIAPQSLKRRRVPGKGAQPLWPGTLKSLKWRIGFLCEPELAPNKHLKIGKFCMKSTKYDIYFDIFNHFHPNFQGWKFVIFKKHRQIYHIWELQKPYPDPTQENMILPNMSGP